MNDINPSDIYTVLRGVNVAMAVFCLAAMVRFVGQWRRLTTDYRFLGAALAGATLGASWAAVETALTGIPGGSRVLVATFWLALAAIGCALLIRKHHHDQTSKES
jgi:hypothetical protein